MSPGDPANKTLRHFYCRDALWDTFESLSEDMDRGVDDLINEAMKAFVESKGAAGRSPSVTPAEAPRLRGRGAPPPPPPGVAARRTKPVGGSDLSDLNNLAGAPPARRPGAPPPPPPSLGRATVPPAARPPAPREVDDSGPSGGQDGAPLFLYFQNQKYKIDKEQFIIGRGSKSSDLPIKDGNISRKHAAVIRRNGSYFIKDLGSTNGIDFRGTRIDNKRIDEGDVFHLCDYELKFTFRR